MRQPFVPQVLRRATGVSVLIIQNQPEGNRRRVIRHSGFRY